MVQLSQVTKVRVHPGLGIARVGNAVDDYFVGPEVPGETADPGGSYRDREGRIKPQACRFRIYALDAGDNVLGELTADQAEIVWRMEVANLKAGWYAFINAMDLPNGMAIPEERRNKRYRGAERMLLDIRPSCKVISGRNVEGDQYAFDDGRFFDQKVYLGEVRTDGDGRLIFLPGRGDSGPKIPGTRPTTFANNDDWHDDVCDGPVRATVTIEVDGETKTFEADRENAGYVVTTPPNFAPGLQGPVTMDDVVRDIYIRELSWLPPIDQPSFTNDIWPIFAHLTGSQWVNHGVFMMIGHNAPANPYDPAVLSRLHSTSAADAPYRRKWMHLFRDPNAEKQEAVALPPFYGSAFSEFVDAPQAFLSVTRTQYDALEKWAEGNFVDDWAEVPTPPSFDHLTPAEQCQALDRVGVYDCLGDAFHPGIEMTWIMRHASMWAAPYRLNLLPEGEATRQNYGQLLTPEVALGPDGPLHASGPGAITRYMGVPWQTDEASCASGYNPHYYVSLPSFWAPRVPNQVLSEQSYQRLIDDNLDMAQRLKHFDYRQDWYRDIQGSGYLDRIANMVTDWWMLGLVEPRRVPDRTGEGALPDIVHVETGRGEALIGTPVDHGEAGVTYRFSDPFFQLIENMETLASQPLEEVALRFTAMQDEARRPSRAPSPLRRSFRRDQR